MQNYDTLRKIGKGAFGVVNLVRRKSDQKLFVLKQMKIGSVSGKEREMCHLEVQLLERLNHPSIVRYEESFIHSTMSETFLCVVMTYCDGGELTHFLKNQRGKKLKEKQVLELFVQIALALHFVHERQILHRDLKSQNIFVKDGQLKLGDFGVSKVLTCSVAFAQTMIGTPYYMSPEVFKGKQYDFKSDVWALGCVLYEMITFRHAFDANNLNSLAQKIVRGKYIPIPTHFRKETKELLHCMLSQNTNLRPNLTEILKKPILKNRIKEYFGSVFKRHQTGGVPDSTFNNLKNQLKGIGYDFEAEMIAAAAAAKKSKTKTTIASNSKSSRKQKEMEIRSILREERAQKEMEAALNKLKNERKWRIAKKRLNSNHNGKNKYGVGGGVGGGGGGANKRHRRHSSSNNNQNGANNNDYPQSNNNNSNVRKHRKRARSFAQGYGVHDSRMKAAKNRKLKLLKLEEEQRQKLLAKHRKKQERAANAVAIKRQQQNSKYYRHNNSKNRAHSKSPQPPQRHNNRQRQLKQKQQQRQKRQAAIYDNDNHGVVDRKHIKSDDKMQVEQLNVWEQMHMQKKLKKKNNNNSERKIPAPKAIVVKQHKFMLSAQQQQQQQQKYYPKNYKSNGGSVLSPSPIVFNLGSNKNNKNGNHKEFDALDQLRKRRELIQKRLNDISERHRQRQQQKQKQQQQSQHTPSSKHKNQYHFNHNHNNKNPLQVQPQAQHILYQSPSKMRVKRKRAFSESPPAPAQAQAPPPAIIVTTNINNNINSLSRNKNNCSPFKFAAHSIISGGGRGSASAATSQSSSSCSSSSNSGASSEYCSPFALNPRERMLRRKRAEADARAQELSNAMNLGFHARQLVAQQNKASVRGTTSPRPKMHHIESQSMANLHQNNTNNDSQPKVLDDMDIDSVRTMSEPPPFNHEHNMNISHAIDTIIENSAEHEIDEELMNDSELAINREQCKDVSTIIEEVEEEEEEIQEMEEIQELKQTLAEHTQLIKELRTMILENSTNFNSTDTDADTGTEVDPKTEVNISNNNVDTDVDESNIESMLLKQEQTMRQTNNFQMNEGVQQQQQHPFNNDSNHNNVNNNINSSLIEIKQSLALIKKKKKENENENENDSTYHNNSHIHSQIESHNDGHNESFNVQNIMSIDCGDEEYGDHGGDSSSSSDDEQMPFGRLLDRIEFLKRKCIAGMGLEGFQVAYTLLKTLQNSKNDDNNDEINNAINDKIKRLCVHHPNISKAKVRKYRAFIDQLLFIQENCS